MKDKEVQNWLEDSRIEGNNYQRPKTTIGAAIGQPVIETKSQQATYQNKPKPDYENPNDPIVKLRDMVGRDVFVMSSMSDLLDLQTILEILEENPELKASLASTGVDQKSLIERLRTKKPPLENENCFNWSSYYPGSKCDMHNRYDCPTCYEGGNDV